MSHRNDLVVFSQDGVDIKVSIKHWSQGTRECGQATPSCLVEEDFCRAAGGALDGAEAHEQFDGERWNRPLLPAHLCVARQSQVRGLNVGVCRYEDF